MVAPGQLGTSAHSFQTYGHSMIVDSWGKIMAEMSVGPVVVSAEIDLDYLAKVRTELLALTHRRLI